MRNIISVIVFLLFSVCAHAQYVRISGTIYDKSKKTGVEFALVRNTSGGSVFTDSLGHYSLRCQQGDSIYIVYNNKPTQRFPVNSIQKIDEFDVSLGITVSSRFKMLPEVLVQAKSYKEDSIENRLAYKNIFGQEKGVKTSIVPGGGVGMDMGSIIDLFRFNYRKRTNAFQERLIKEEQQKYVQYRFSKVFVSRATGLAGAALDEFMKRYTPEYSMLASWNELKLTEYTIAAFKDFQQSGYKMNPEARVN